MLYARMAWKERRGRARGFFLTPSLLQGAQAPSGKKISQRPWVLPRAFLIGGSEVGVGMDRTQGSPELGAWYFSLGAWG